MIALNNMEDTADDQADMTVGDKLAFIMNAQAEKKDMNKLNVDAFLEWADQFDGAALFLHMKDFVSMYLGSRQTTSTPKKGVSRPTGTELDEMEEGLVMDMVIESGNDACSDEYCQVADQRMMDAF